MAVPTTVIKQENIVSPKKEIPQTSCSSGQILVHTSTMAPMHVEIKKESLADEIASPQSKAPDAGDTPTSISGDSSCSSILDAQGG